MAGMGNPGATGRLAAEAGPEPDDPDPDRAAAMRLGIPWHAIDQTLRNLRQEVGFADVGQWVRDQMLDRVRRESFEHPDVLVPLEGQTGGQTPLRLRDLYRELEGGVSRAFPRPRQAP